MNNKKEKKGVARPYAGLTRSEIARRARNEYLKKHPASHPQFITIRTHRVVVDELRGFKPHAESWGRFLLRLAKSAGYKVTVSV